MQERQSEDLLDKYKRVVSEGKDPMLLAGEENDAIERVPDYEEHLRRTHLSATSLEPLLPDQRLIAVMEDVELGDPAHAKAMTDDSEPGHRELMRRAALGSGKGRGNGGCLRHLPWFLVLILAITLGAVMRNPECDGPAPAPASLPFIVSSLSAQEVLDILMDTTSVVALRFNTTKSKNPDDRALVYVGKNGEAKRRVYGAEFGHLTHEHTGTWAIADGGSKIRFTWPVSSTSNTTQLSAFTRLGDVGLSWSIAEQQYAVVYNENIMPGGDSYYQQYPNANKEFHPLPEQRLLMLTAEETRAALMDKEVTTHLSPAATARFRHAYHGDVYGAHSGGVSGRGAGPPLSTPAVTMQYHSNGSVTRLGVDASGAIASRHEGTWGVEVDSTLPIDPTAYFCWLKFPELYDGTKQTTVWYSAASGLVPTAGFPLQPDGTAPPEAGYVAAREEGFAPRKGIRPHS
jgi:hypothetical protein